MKVEKEVKRNGAILDVVKVWKCEGKGKSPLRAFATVTFGGLVTVSGIKLLEYKDGNWSCEFPSTKGKDEKGNDTYYPIAWFNAGDKDSNRDLYEALTKAVYEEYSK